MTVALADAAWVAADGRIPDGQQCRRFGGDGTTPALKVDGVPPAAKAIEVSFNDESYSAMNFGGHGVIRFDRTGRSPTEILPSVPGETESLPAGVVSVHAFRNSEWFRSYGAYGPPCSGGKNNLYTADVRAIDGAGTTLAKGKVTLGRY